MRLLSCDGVVRSGTDGLPQLTPCDVPVSETPKRSRIKSIDHLRVYAAFTVCTFWLAEALAMTGQVEQGRAVFEQVLALHNGLGLYAEDMMAGQQTGNFPQTYSHVGLIHAAFRLSPPWD